MVVNYHLKFAHSVVCAASSSNVPYKKKNWIHFKSFFVSKPSSGLVLCDDTTLIRNVSLICECQAFVPQGEILAHHTEESNRGQGLGYDAC